MPYDHALTKRAGIVGLGTTASRILGLVRDSVIAAYFPKEAIDAFQVAFMIPNSFRRLTAEGAFSISVTSVFSKIWIKGDMEESRRFVAVTAGFSLFFLSIITILGMVGAEGLAWLAGQGFAEDEAKFGLTVSLTRSMFPYVLLVSLTALAMGVLNSAGRFFSPAFAPVLLNIATIGAAVCLTGTVTRFGWHPIHTLVVGTLLGGLLQLLSQIISLRRIKLLVIPAIDWKHPGLRRVLKLTFPMIFGAAAYQVGLFLSSSFASGLGPGSVTYIQFATRLMEMPLAILVMSISTAALPALSALRGEGRMDELKQAYGQSLRLALFVTTPAMAALVMLAEPVMTVLYQRGLFTHADVIETAGALVWMALGICSVALVRQTVPVFYALENTRAPVLMTMANILVFVAAAIPLKGLFGHRGLCMALSIAVTAQGLGLVTLLRRRIGRLGFGHIVSGWWRMLLCAAVMAGVVYGVSRLGRWEAGGNSPRNIAVLALTVFLGIAIYGGMAYLLRISEMRDLSRGIARRFPGSTRRK